MNCPDCGAKRPKEEIDHKSCANCRDLKVREDAVKNAEAIKASREAAEKKGQEDLKNLPDLDKAASGLYDNERGVWWLGVNLKSKDADPVGLLFVVDQFKGHLIQSLLEWRKTQQKRESLIVRTGDSIVGLINSAKKSVPKTVKDILAIKT